MISLLHRHRHRIAWIIYSSNILALPQIYQECKERHDRRSNRSSEYEWDKLVYGGHFEVSGGGGCRQWGTNGSKDQVIAVRCSLSRLIRAQLLGPA